MQSGIGDIDLKDSNGLTSEEKAIHDEEYQQWLDQLAQEEEDRAEIRRVIPRDCGEIDCLGCRGSF